MEDFLKFWYSSNLDGIAFVAQTDAETSQGSGFRYQHVNSSFARLLKQKQEDLAGQAVKDYFLPGEEKELLTALESVLETGTNKQLTLDYSWKTGDRVWLVATLSRMDNQVMIKLQDVSEQKKTELDLQRRLAMESLIATIASRLVTVKAQEVDAFIEEALEKISLHTGAERASVFQYSEDDQRGSCTHEWCAPGISSQKAAIQNVPMTSFVWTYQRLSNGQVLQIDVDTLSDGAAQEKEIFSRMAINSMIAIPMVREEKTRGFIAFYTLNKAKKWFVHDISLLETFCTLIANCLYKVKQEEAISRANFRLEGLREIDQALLSSRLSDRPPLFIALKYIHFMVPSERITVFIIDEASHRAFAKCRMINGEIALNPDFTIPSAYFHDQFARNPSGVYYANFEVKSAGLNALIPNYESLFKCVLIVPLLYQGTCIGAFTLASATPYFFTEEYQEIVRELANQLAIVLYQQQLDDQLEDYTNQLEQRVDERTREIKQLSTLHQAILKHAGQAIISTDTQGVIQTANQACEHLLGFLDQELIGRITHILPGTANDPTPGITFTTVQSPQPLHTTTLCDLAAQGYFYGEYKAVGSAGQSIPVLLATSLLANEDGVTIGYVCIITDISALKLAEAQLQHKNRELNTIFDGAIDLHCLIGTDGNLLTVNRAWEATLGYTQDELVTRTFWGLVLPHEQAAVQTNLQVVVTNQCLRNKINQFRKKDGGILILEWNAVSIDGQIYASARDITIRQQSEAQLRSLNQRLQLATVATGQGIWENDFITNRIDWDDRVWEMYGFTESQTPWTYQDFLHFVHPDDTADYLEVSQGLMNGQANTFTYSFRIVRRDGAIRHVENTGMIQRDQSGTPIRMIGVSSDITERREAEETLRESEQRFREIAENVDEVFWIHSLDPFKLLYINPAYERIWNRSATSMYENPASFIDAIVEDDKATALDFLKRYQEGKEAQLSYRIQKPDGSIRWLSIRTFNKRDKEGKIIRLIGIVNDITSQKEKELVLQQALQREQELNQLKSQFVSTASHEFRTPLATIQTSVELVKLYLDSPASAAKPSIQKHLAVIEKEVESFSLLLSDILTIEKIESGKVSFSPQWTDIIATCNFVSTTHFTRENESREVRLSIEGTARQVYIDEKLISHVIINLLSNAFKFSESSPSLRLIFQPDTVLLQVADDGIGIPASEVATLFQAFFRATNTIGIPGTGLGLVIAQQFIELHGGQISVLSKESKGTTFTVTLPISGSPKTRTIRHDTTPFVDKTFLY
jgi:PAS domain S-box-containing protein